MFYFFKKKIIKNLGTSIFANSVKFLPTTKSSQFFFPLKKKKKRKDGIFKILTGFNRKF
jgi:hypothetical protein